MEIFPFFLATRLWGRLSQSDGNDPFFIIPIIAPSANGPQEGVVFLLLVIRACTEVAAVGVRMGTKSSYDGDDSSLRDLEDAPISCLSLRFVERWVSDILANVTCLCECAWMRHQLRCSRRNTSFLKNGGGPKFCHSSEFGSVFTGKILTRSSQEKVLIFS